MYAYRATLTDLLPRPSRLTWVSTITDAFIVLNRFRGVLRAGLTARRWRGNAAQNRLTLCTRRSLPLFITYAATMNLPAVAAPWLPARCPFLPLHTKFGFYGACRSAAHEKTYMFAPVYSQ